jgi:hypothetical protein
MLRRWTTTGLLALLPFTLCACGGDEGFRFDVYPVDGQVTRGGKPVPRVFVRFHPADPSKVTVPNGQVGGTVMLTSETDAEGRFVMSTYVADDGIPAGDYTVTIVKLSAPVEGDGESSAENEKDDAAAQPAPPADPAAVPALYNDPATSTLKVTVGTGPNHFDLKAD